MKKILKKILWFPIMVLAIPLDIVFWNLFFGLEFGFCTPKQSVFENWHKWKTL